jgi:hypothetical protein
MFFGLSVSNYLCWRIEIEVCWIEPQVQQNIRQPRAKACNTTIPVVSQII